MDPNLTCQALSLSMYNTIVTSLRDFKGRFPYHKFLELKYCDPEYQNIDILHNNSQGNHALVESTLGWDNI